MIELTPLRYFLCAYEGGTFSRAAQASGVSQPTVSAAIQKLETQLGEPLFLRSKSGLTPTSLGEQLYREAGDSVARLSGLEARLRRRPRQPVSIYCRPDILLGGFAPALHGLRRAEAHLQFRFAELPEACDLSYTSATCVPPDHRFLPVLTESFGVALDRHHPLATRETVAPQELEGQAIIHRPYCPNAEGFDLPIGDRQPAPAHAVHDQQVLDLVAAGIGIAFVPMSHARANAGVVVLPLRGVEAGQRTIGVSYRKTAFAREIAEKLAALARAG
ncbi:LysR family transcriptional regulator [Pseudodonghicola sp.]|jgi:DNA-binding transcriptional LysR family regulator|uniref:LysR family transcriptional regulator n=1 Tax=Pseudodonghicola sp. TaxID=1969463 RepID=UPI003A976546